MAWISVENVKRPLAGSAALHNTTLAPPLIVESHDEVWRWHQIEERRCESRSETVDLEHTKHMTISLRDRNINIYL